MQSGFRKHRSTTDHRFSACSHCCCSSVGNGTGGRRCDWKSISCSHKRWGPRILIDELDNCITFLNTVQCFINVRLMLRSTFNLLKFRRPSYLYQFVQPYTPSRNLQPLNQNLLVVNRAHSAFAERSFRRSSAAVWNSLPAKWTYCWDIQDMHRVMTKKNCMHHFLTLRWISHLK